MGSQQIAQVPLIVIVGETASGKTAASIKLALDIGGEIICADSRTVYKLMDIGTAKPSREEQKLVPHHLIDIIEPNKKFSVAKFQRLAHKCIQDIYNRGKMPIMVGGTGLYIDSVLYNFQFTSKADDEYRAQLEQMTDEELTTLLHTKNIDTSKLNTKNRRHVIRAIEREGEVAKNTQLRKNTLVLGLEIDRETLKARIAQRTDEMFQNGLIDEVKNLTRKYGNNLEAFKAPGYRAVIQYLKNELSVQGAKEEFIRADLQLAKRQRTWFKRNKSIEWFDDPELLIAKAVEFASQFNYN